MRQLITQARQKAGVLLRRAAVTAALLGAFCQSVSAGLYDDTQTRPGTTIENIASISWGKEGVDPDPIHLHNDLVVVPISTPGSLRAYRHAPENPDALTFNLRRPNYAADVAGQQDFRQMPPPGSGLDLPADVPLAETDRILQGADVFFVLEDAGLNFDSSSIESLRLVLTDHLTGDKEVLEIFETGPDTGIFAGHVCACANEARPGDGQLSTTPHSRIDAVYQDPWRSDRRFDDMVLVGPMDPHGLVFDSRTGAPMNGVEITLIDMETGAPAVVYGEDLVSPYPATITTGATVEDASGQGYVLEAGEYRFPFVGLGQYRIEVDPPRGYIAPSEVEDAHIQALPGSPYALSPASRLEPFEVAAGSVLKVDIPLDGSALIDVTRAGSADALTIGDAIEFTVSVGTNVRGALVVDVLDTLPTALRVDLASVRINGEKAPDRTEISEDGTSLVFRDVVIPDGQRAAITYVARITAAAREGTTLESHSTARARGFISNTATHTLSIDPVFDIDRTVVLGQIFGTGCAARFDPSLDLSGLRIYTENGRYVETDEAGLFSFRGLPAGTHVLQIDPLSVPAGFEPVLCENSTRRAGSSTSVFSTGRGGFSEQVYFHLKPVAEAAGAKTKGSAIAPQARVHDLDRAWLDTTKPDPGIVFPTPGYLPRTKSLELGVVRKSEQVVKVRLNGEPVQPIHRRPAIGNGKGSLFLDIWTGAALRIGDNQVEVEIHSADGDLVLEDSAVISYNDRIDQLGIVEGKSDLTTDGRRSPHLVFEARNHQGARLHPGTMVAISVAPPFEFIGETPEDAPTRRRSATVDSDGLFRLDLAPVRASGTAEFTISTDDGPVTTTAYISAADRPWLIVGLAEGTAAHASISRHMTSLRDTEIAKLGDIEVHGRISLFAEGVIDGKWLTTLRYDSGIASADRDFFAIDPDAQYIVYGDASTEGDAAQSRHALYLRLKSERDELLYGDFSTDLTVGSGEYARRLTGGRLTHDGETIDVQAFAASTAQVFRKDIFAANGTSGPFDLLAENISPFSERVRVETSARTDSERLVETRSLKRGQDYDIDYDAGRIFLAEPLLARDSELNTNALVVEYEVEEAGDEGLLVGGRIATETRFGLKLGASAVHEEHVAGTDGAAQIYGADASLDLGPSWTARLGFAHSSQEASDTLEAGASAHSAELGLTGKLDGGSIEIYARSQDTNFGIDNQRPDGEADQLVSAGVTADILLSEKVWEGEEGQEHSSALALQAEGKTEINLDTEARRDSAEAMILRSQDSVVRGGGLRFERNDLGTGAPTTSSLKALGVAQWRSPDDRLFLGVGQELTLSESGAFDGVDRGTIEAEYRFSDAVTLRAGHEIAIGDDLRANILTFGSRITPWNGSTIDVGALRAGAGGVSHLVGHAGVNQEFRLSEAWSINAGIEGQKDLSDASEGPIALAGLSNPRLSEGYTSASLGAKHTGEHHTFGAGLEHRISETSRGTRLRFTAAGEASSKDDFGLSASFYRGTTASGAAERDYQVKASLAHRPRDDRKSLLDHFELRLEDEGAGTRLTALNSIFHAHEFAPGRHLNLRHGLKYASFDFGEDSYSDVLNLIGAEYRHDLSDWLDAGLHGSVLHSMETRTTRYSAGASIGFTPFDNGWISVGYNLAGFEDEDFSANGYTDQGAFVQFRMKFDANTLRR